MIDTIICRDAISILKKMPPKSVDLIFADPPFNVGKAYKDKRENYYQWCGEWIGLCFRVLKSTGSFYLMTIPRHLSRVMRFMDIKGEFINLITWRNVASVSSKRTFWGEYQPILLYGKTDQYIFNTYAQRTLHPINRWGKMTTAPQGQMKDRWDDIQFIWAGNNTHPEAVMAPGTNKKAHPCQMPVALAERAILFSTNEGNTVLDPFMGSGSTAIGAIRTNRHYIGIELEQKFVDLSEERIRQEQSQLKLDLLP